MGIKCKACQHGRCERLLRRGSRHDGARRGQCRCGILPPLTRDRGRDRPQAMSQASTRPAPADREPAPNRLIFIFFQMTPAVRGLRPAATDSQETGRHEPFPRPPQNGCYRAEELRKIDQTGAKAQTGAPARICRKAALDRLNSFFSGCSCSAMIFEKPFNPHPRVSFDVGMRQLGGQSIVLVRSRTCNWEDGESISPTPPMFCQPLYRRDHDPHDFDAQEHPDRHGRIHRDGAGDQRPDRPTAIPARSWPTFMTFEERRGPIAGQRLCLDRRWQQCLRFLPACRRPVSDSI